MYRKIYSHANSIRVMNEYPSTHALRVQLGMLLQSLHGNSCQHDTIKIKYSRHEVTSTYYLFLFKFATTTN